MMKKKILLLIGVLTGVIFMFLTLTNCQPMHRRFSVDAGGDKVSDINTPVSFKGEVTVIADKPVRSKILDLAGVEISFDRFVWAFGDGEATVITTNATVTHHYTVGGTYTATFYAHATDGATESDTCQVSIQSPIFSEDFESGDLSAWTVGGDAVPFVQTEEVYEGNYAVQFGDIDDNQSSYLQIQVTLSSDAVISFYRKTSSDLGRDHLQFYIDDVFAGEWSGDIGWHQVIRGIPAGTHTLKWVYVKNSWGSSSQDTAWIDDITILSDMDLGEEVNVPDSNLRSTILAYLGKNPGATASAMMKLARGRPMEGYGPFGMKDEITTPEFLTYDEEKIYAKELLDFVEFSARESGISDVTGLEYMHDLRYLHLASNQITDITPLQNLTNLNWLYLWGNQITDITPLQNLTNLYGLNLGDNQITDITSLQNLTNLQELYLYDNHITDITPLVDNTGIGEGDYVDIRYNYLDLTSGSDDMQNIQTLLDRGVSVQYDPQNN